MVLACCCHDSHGTSWDKEGNITENYEVRRCVKHQDRPSIYTNLPVRDKHTKLKDAVVAAAKVWAEAAWHTEDRENPYDELMGAVKALIKFERE